jgi:DNA replication protein DnaD
MAKKSSSKIKNVPQYEALREKGMSKEKAARIANTNNPDYNSKPYEERTKKELYQKAKEVGIPKISSMNKAELIKALREH